MQLKRVTCFGCLANAGFFMPAPNRRKTMGKHIVQFLTEKEYYRRIKSCGFTISHRSLKGSVFHTEEEPKEQPHYKPLNTLEQDKLEDKDDGLG